MNIPPPMPQSTVIIEYPGNWVLFESFLSTIKLFVNGIDYGKIPFKQPKTIVANVPGPVVFLKATLGGMRTANISFPIEPGKTYKVILEYDRIWGSISFYRFPGT